MDNTEILLKILCFSSRSKKSYLKEEEKTVVQCHVLWVYYLTTCSTMSSFQGKNKVVENNLISLKTTFQPALKAKSDQDFNIELVCFVYLSNPLQKYITNDFIMQFQVRDSCQVYLKTTLS